MKRKTSLIFLAAALAFALLPLLLVLGCAPKAPARVVLPPTPSTSSTAGAVDDARENTVAAQSNVRAGQVEAKADRGPAAVPFLVKADAQLSDALAALAAATSHVGTLEASIKASDAAYKNNLAALNTDLGNASAANKKLAAENDKLRNEVLRQAKLRIGAVGVGLMILSIGFVAGAFWGKWPLGFKLAPVAFSMGAGALALAEMLSKIILVAEIVFGVAVLAFLALAAWQLLNHTPAEIAERLKLAEGEVESLKTSRARALLKPEAAQ